MFNEESIRTNAILLGLAAMLFLLAGLQTDYIVRSVFHAATMAGYFVGKFRGICPHAPKVF